RVSSQQTVVLSPSRASLTALGGGGGEEPEPRLAGADIRLLNDLLDGLRGLRDALLGGVKSLLLAPVQQSESGPLETLGPKDLASGSPEARQVEVRTADRPEADRG